MIILPTPPNDVEKLSYSKTGRVPFYTFGIVSFILLITGMWLFSISHPYFYLYSLFSLATTFYLSLSYLVGLFSSDFDLDKHLDIFKKYYSKIPRHYPSVDIYLPCCGEDVEVIKNTYKYVAFLTKRWPGKVNVYILDDGWSDEVQKLAIVFGFNYIRRDNKGFMKKAGNLRHAFNLTNSEFIVIFDADFCPREDFLIETMPYFDDENIAIVQTPQFFSISKDQSWVEKGAAYIQELFYRLIQVNRNHFNGSICVGTCAVYRREALEPFGGTANIAYSEDVHTGFNCVNNGWRILYLPLNLSKGVCPNTLPSFFIQQYRWAMGSLTLLSNKMFWMSNLTVWQKICYLSGMFYYATTGLAIFLAPIPAMVLVWFAPNYVLIHNAIYSVPSFVFGILFMAHWTRAEFGWYGPKARMVSYFAHIFAILDKARGSLVPWQATGAVKGIKRFEDFRSLMFWWTTASSVSIIAGIFYRIHEYGFLNFAPMLFFASYNYWLCMSILRDQE